MREARALVLSLVLAVPTLASAAPMLSLVESGTTSTTVGTIPFGTASYSLDIRVNTDGNTVSGLQYYIQTSPADAVKYGTTPVTALNNPFTSADLAFAPSSGATAKQSGGRTAWFTFNPDYAAFSNNGIATYQFDTSDLPIGTYIFTPVGEEFESSNSSTTITSFAAPGAFTLNVVPEPSAVSLLILGGCLMIRRRCR